MKHPKMIALTASLAVALLPANSNAQQPETFVITLISVDTVRVNNTVTPTREVIPYFEKRYAGRGQPQPFMTLEKCKAASTDAFKALSEGLQKSKLFIVLVDLRDPPSARCAG